MPCGTWFGRVACALACACVACGLEAAAVAGYVSDGLVGQWDGIDNAGTGTHDPAATVWKDLTGLTGDGTLNANVKWNGGNSWTNGVDGKPVTVGVNFANTMNTGFFTVEYVLKPTRTGTRETLLGGYAPGQWNFEHNSGSYTDGSTRFYFNGKPDYRAQYAPIVANESATIAVVFRKNGVFTVYKNGQRAGGGTCTSRPVANTATYVGGESARENMAFRGAYYALRLYNRTLTEAEVAANAACDATRFGFTPTAPCVPAGGYLANNGTFYAYAYPLFEAAVAQGASNAIAEVTLKKRTAWDATPEDVSFADFQALTTGGTLLKTGSGVLTLDKHLNTYNGNVHVAEGVVIGCASNCLGSTQSTIKQTYVHAGATLVMDDPGNTIAKQDRKQIYYEGTGVSGLGGAFVIRSGGKATYSYWPLQVQSRPTGSATVFIDAPSGGGAKATYSSDGNNNNCATDIQLAGMPVLLYGRTPGSLLLFNACQMLGIGSLVVSNMTLTLSGNSSSLGFTGLNPEIRFTGGARWKNEKYVAINNTEFTQTGRLVIDDLEYYELARTGDTGWDPYANQSNNWWRGEVVLNGDLRFYNSRGTLTKEGFTFNKKVSGPGGIRSWYNAKGQNCGNNTWVHLMGTENTFTGGISLNASTLCVWRNGAVPAQEGAGAVVITNGWLHFRRLNDTTAWDDFTMPEIVIEGTGTVTNGTGTCAGLVKKGTGVLDYDTQLGGGYLDLQGGTVRFNTRYRAAYTGDNAAYAPAGYTGALPAFTTLKGTAGTLDPGGTAEDPVAYAVTALAGTPAVTNGSLTVTDTWTVDVATLGQGAVRVSGTLAFGKTAAIVLAGDLEKVPSPGAAGYLVAKAASVTGLPTRRGEWQFRAENGEVRLCHLVGTALIVR